MRPVIHLKALSQWVESPPLQDGRPSLWASMCPWAFTNTMKAVVTLLWSWGIRIVIYNDNILIMAESALLAAQYLGDQPGFITLRSQ